MENSDALNIKLTWDGQSGAEIKLATTYPLKIDLPAEFGGHGRYPCPNELFFASIGGCLITEFLYFRKKLNFMLRGLQVDIEGKEEMFGSEGYRITHIRATITIETVERDRDEVETCIELTKKYCPLTRTLEKAIPIEVNTQIRMLP